ncbi:MAG: O-antigen ligase family protein [Pseudomonadota bacterium]
MAWYGNAALTSLALGWFTASVIWNYEPLGISFQRIQLVVILFLCVIAWIIIQILPLDISALSHPLWQMSAQALQEDIPGRISINPEQSEIGLIRLLTYAGVFWLALQFGRDPEKAKILLYSIVIAITVYASYGLILKILESHTILWFAKEHYKDSLTSTFINRNSAATYFGLGCTALLALMVSHLRRNLFHASPKKVFLSQLIQTITSMRMLISIYALFVTFAALVLTGSRAGLIVTIIAMLCLLLIYMLKSKQKHWVYISGLCLMLVAISFILEASGDFLGQRLQNMEALVETSRMKTYALTLTMINDFPFTGTGLGTYGNIFPMYRDSSIPSYGVWDKAHNTYLELILELGIPAALLLFCAVFLLIKITLRGVFERKKNSNYSAIAFTCSVLVGLHSLVDFSLQIQAITITYMVLLGIGVSQSWGSRRRNL